MLRPSPSRFPKIDVLNRLFNPNTASINSVRIMCTIHRFVLNPAAQRIVNAKPISDILRYV
jgi:hypothetical protein